MSEKADKAGQIHAGGGNCAQAVLVAMLQGGELSPEQAMGVAACFGGGMGRGEMCGAVTGGLMALGLRHGAKTPEDQAAKKASKDVAADFIRRFGDRFGSCECKELLRQNGRKICGELISGAVEILEDNKLA